jgi:hypothetical protein
MCTTNYLANFNEFWHERLTLETVGEDNIYVYFT